MDDARLRADLYLLLAALLREPPTAGVLVAVRALDVAGDDALAEALRELVRAAARADVDGVVAEFHDLFIGVTGGALMPYASWYRRGSLHEAPLAELRRDLRRLGLARTADCGEPEDHIAALCEAMVWLIQEDHPDCMGFFRRHLEAWGARFFHDLACAEAARFYRRVAGVGSRFLARERLALGN